MSKLACLVIGAVGASVALAGCERKDDAHESPASPSATGSVAPAPPKPAEPPAPSAEPSATTRAPTAVKPSGLPPIADTDVPVSKWIEARRLHREAMTLEKKKKLGEAAEKFRASIAIDPAHIHPRVRLASVLAAQNDREAAISILRELNAHDSDASRQRLAAIADDPSFAVLKADGGVPELFSVESDVAVGTLVREANTVAAWMRNPSKDRFPPSLEKARLVTTVVRCNDCPDTEKSMVSLEVSDWARGFASVLFVGRGVLCEGRCCSYGAFDRQLGGTTGSGRVLHRACFEQKDDGAVLKRLEIY